MQWHLKLLNYLFRRRSKKTSKLTGLCAGNSPVTREFPTQKASKAENVSIWWRHHDVCSGVIEVSVMYTPSGCALNTNPINTLILSTCYISWLKLILQWRLNLVLNYDNMSYCTYKNKKQKKNIVYWTLCPACLLFICLSLQTDYPAPGEHWCLHTSWSDQWMLTPRHQELQAQTSTNLQTPHIILKID